MHRRLSRIAAVLLIGPASNAKSYEKPHPHDEKPLACVTGGSGFIAGHVCRLLKDAGYRVRATVRSREPAKTGYIEAMGVDLVGGCDLMVPGSFDAALEGCEYVHHIATPFSFVDPAKPLDPMKEFVEPAVQGTQNVLLAAQMAGTVKRVVLTSSCAAITWGNPTAKGESYVWTESDWQLDNTVENGPYRYAKRKAEEIAWHFVKAEQPGFDMAVVNPAFVIGPVLSPRADAQSIRFLKSLLDGSKDEVGADAFGVVDVRDVAQAHVNAMTASLTIDSGAFNSNNEARFILSSERTYSMLELATMLHGSPDLRHHYRIPTSAVGPQKQNLTYSNKRARHVLGISFRDPRQSMLEGAQSLIKFGIIAPPKSDL